MPFREPRTFRFAAKALDRREIPVKQEESICLKYETIVLSNSTLFTYGKELNIE